MGRSGPLTTVGVLEQNFTSDALSDTTPVKLVAQFLAGSLVLGAGTNSQGSESKWLLIWQYGNRLYRSKPHIWRLSPVHHLEDSKLYTSAQYVIVLSAQCFIYCLSVTCMSFYSYCFVCHWSLVLIYNTGRITSICCCFTICAELWLPSVSSTFVWGRLHQHLIHLFRILITVCPLTVIVKIDLGFINFIICCISCRISC